MRTQERIGPEYTQMPRPTAKERKNELALI